MFLHRDGESLTVTGYKRNIIKLIVLVFLCVITFPITLLVYLLLDFWKPKWKVLILHSSCPIFEAVLVIVQEKGLFTPQKIRNINFDCNSSSHLIKKLGAWTNPNTNFRMFEYKMDRYVITESKIELITALGAGEHFRTLQEYSEGWNDTKSVGTLSQIYGKNILDVPLPPLIYFVLTEVLTFFYIFQLFSCILWYTNRYEVYATMIIAMSVVSAGSTTYLTRKTVVKLKKTVEFECEVQVKRDGILMTVKSGQLIPGDLVKIPREPLILSFDGILLSGNVVVDEAMLTGESVPVLKNPIPLERLDEEYRGEKDEVNTLFSGTTILQSRPDKSGEVYVIVTQTGFSTKKGTTVKFMLFPKKQKFKFYSEAYTYIKIMGVIGFCGMVYTFTDGIMSHMGIGAIIKNTLDLITIIIAPSLPLALSIAVTYAIRRLKQKKIKCAIPNAINIAGKIKMTVFDKTGTLTEEGLTLYSVLPTVDGVFVEEQFKVVTAAPRPCLGCCHSLSIINNKICGDPIDVIGLQTSEFQFKDDDFDRNVFSNDISAVAFDPAAADEYYGIVRIIPFESQMKRMTVVCEKKDSKELVVFCKGAPEQVLLHCLPDTVPPDFNKQLDHYSALGYRIIALASKTLPSTMDIETAPRAELESDLACLGLLILSNKLKEITKPVIEELQAANVRVVMCTGDNLLTALCVGRDCSMIPDYADLFIVTAELKEDGELKVQYTKQQHKSVMSVMDMGEDPDRYAGPLRKTHLAMDGKTFSLIAQYKHGIMDKIAVTGTVFARFSPEEKMLLVEELQKMDYSVCMCGDGANDCEALQHANVGIALSKCEASLAAPFNCPVFDISCVPVLLKEGQGALENSMSVFRFTAMYSVIQYLSVLLLVKYNSVLGDYQYLFEDIGIVLLFDFALGYTKPVSRLSKKRPRGSLLHPFILYSFIVHTIIDVCFLLMIMYLVQQQTWYNDFAAERQEAVDKNDRFVLTYETTVTFLQSSFQYIICALAFSIGRPHRQPVYTNVPMLIATGVAIGLLLLVLFLDTDQVPGLQFARLSLSFKFYIVAFAVLNFLLALQVEYSYRILQPLQRFLRFFRCKTGYKNKFKYVIDELNTDSDWPSTEEKTI